MSCSSFVGRLIGGRPKCRTFYLEIDPEAFVYQLPSVFHRRFRHELSSKVLFRDNHGNGAELALERGFLDCLIIDGYMQLCNFYNLQSGGWLKVYYFGDGVFRIRVRDIDMCRVRYPYPPRRLTFGQPIGIGFHAGPFYDVIPQAFPDPFVQPSHIQNLIDRLILSDSHGHDAAAVEPIVAQVGPIVPPFLHYSHNLSKVSTSIGEGIEVYGASFASMPPLEAHMCDEAIEGTTAETLDQNIGGPLDVGLNDIDDGTVCEEVENSAPLDSVEEHIPSDYHQTHHVEEPGDGLYQFDILIAGIDSKKNAEDM